MRPYLLCALLALFSCTLNAQHIPEGYKHLGDLDISMSNYFLPTELWYFKEANVVAVHSGFKKSLTEIFRVDTWEKVGSFNASQWLSIGNSFSDPEDHNVLYFGGRRKLHRYNLSTQVYDLISKKKLKNIPGDLYSNFTMYSMSNHGDVTMYMIPERYIITIDKNLAKIYLWEGLLGQ